MQTSAGLYASSWLHATQAVHGRFKAIERRFKAMGGTDQSLAGMICSPRSQCRHACDPSTDGIPDIQKGGSGLEAKKLKAARLTERTLPRLQPCRDRRTGERVCAPPNGRERIQFMTETQNWDDRKQTCRTQGRELECVCRGDIRLGAHNIAYVLQKRKHIGRPGRRGQKMDFWEQDMEHTEIICKCRHGEGGANTDNSKPK